MTDNTTVDTSRVHAWMLNNGFVAASYRADIMHIAEQYAAHCMDEAMNTIAEFINHPEGCSCPNNGGGDCPWCVAQSMALEIGKP